MFIALFSRGIKCGHTSRQTYWAPIRRPNATFEGWQHIIKSFFFFLFPALLVISSGGTILKPDQSSDINILPQKLRGNKYTLPSFSFLKVKFCWTVKTCLLLLTGCGLHDAFRGCSRIANTVLHSIYIKLFTDVWLHLILTGLQRTVIYLFMST